MVSTGRKVANCDLSVERIYNMALKAGTARVDITPPLGTRLSGAFFERRATDIGDPLHARALFLDDGRTHVAVVSCDLLSLKNRTVAHVRTLISDKLGIPGENLLFHATHTHFGPQTTDLFLSEADEEYLANLERHLVSVVELAKQNRREATVGFGKGREDSLVFNRRYHMADGKVVTQPLKGDPTILNSEGPIDPDVGVMYVQDSDGRDLAFVVNHACHPTVISQNGMSSSVSSISADYPGCVVSKIEEYADTGATALFFNGTSGNIWHIDVKDLDKKDSGIAWARRMGAILAAEVMKTVNKIYDHQLSQDVAIKVRRGCCQIPIRSISEEDITWATEYLKEYEQMTPEQRTIPEEPHSTWTRPEVRRVFAREIVLLEQERQQNPVVDIEIQVIQMGNAVLVALPAEVFVEYGLAIKEASPYPHTFLITLANGMVGYIPTQKAFDGGSYEITAARSSKLVPEAGNQVVEKALQIIGKV